ncbi:MAG: hypothetical protein PHP92_03820 [Candidatus Nanoarchaeia archaeon]|nr:hypothetical protein [Candidatus Nanoarchaeia archaeon]
MIKCPNCKKLNKVDKGRAMDGRRAYRCKICGKVWTEGLQNRKQKYSSQREGYQFADSKGSGHVR